MRAGIITIVFLVLLTCLGSANAARAQDAAGATGATPTQTVRPSETRVPLTEPAVAFDLQGQTAFAGRLRTTQLTGTPDAPGRNVRFIIENRTTLFFTYLAGWTTFYDAEGVRCGEGAWKLEALAPNESAEVDTPGLRLTCAPATWRIIATNLLTRTGDLAKPETPALPLPVESSIPTASPAAATSTPATIATLPPLEININGQTIPLQPGHPLEITVGKERVRIVVNAVP